MLTECSLRCGPNLMVLCSVCMSHNKLCVVVCHVRWGLHHLMLIF